MSTILFQVACSIVVVREGKTKVILSEGSTEDNSLAAFEKLKGAIDIANKNGFKFPETIIRDFLDMYLAGGAYNVQSEWNDKSSMILSITAFRAKT
jgi:hypothetical protein